MKCFVGLKANDLDQAFKMSSDRHNAEFMMMSKTIMHAYRGTIFNGVCDVKFRFNTTKLKYHDLYLNIIVVSKNLINELNQEPNR